MRTSASARLTPRGSPFLEHPAVEPAHRGGHQPPRRRPARQSETGQCRLCDVYFFWIVTAEGRKPARHTLSCMLASNMPDKHTAHRATIETNAHIFDIAQHSTNSGQVYFDLHKMLNPSIA